MKEIMREIVLNNGMICTVDDEDYEEVTKIKWRALKDKTTTYAVYSPQKGAIVRMTRLIMGMPTEGYVIDHIDGNGINNQKSNLRFVTKRQNSQNRHHHKTSIYPGVYRHKNNSMFRAEIRIMGKRKHLGWFKNEEDAYNAYKAKVHELGEIVLPI